MGAYVASQLVKAMVKKRIHVDGAKVLLMGLAFKENCPDLRNTKVVDIVAELREYNIQVDVHDPWVDAVEAKFEYGITPVAEPSEEEYDGIIVAVAHRQFKAMDERAIRAFGRPKHVLYDLKYILPADASDIRL
jgi:UDP-N-acetyl-D-galactosamine dehydrogenase